MLKSLRAVVLGLSLVPNAGIPTSSSGHIADDAVAPLPIISGLALKSTSIGGLPRIS